MSVVTVVIVVTVVTVVTKNAVIKFNVNMTEVTVVRVVLVVMKTKLKVKCEELKCHQNRNVTN